VLKPKACHQCERDLDPADRRFQLALIVAFGCAAALLAALGVSGVVFPHCYSTCGQTIPA
jgi:hypothetical protein